MIDFILSALLAWLNTFSLPVSIFYLYQLSDGLLLWKVLVEIDTHYFLDKSPHRSLFDPSAPKWRLLECLHKHLLIYTREQNNGTIPPGLKTNLDLRAIADCRSDPESCELIKFVLLAAINSPNFNHHIRTLQSLPVAVQKGLKIIIQEAEEPSRERLDQLRRDKLMDMAEGPAIRNPDFRAEQQIGKLIANNERLSSDKKDLEDEIERLRGRLSDLAARDQSSSSNSLILRKLRKRNITPNTMFLEYRTRQQAELIALQDASLADLQSQVENLQQVAESAQRKNKHLEKLQADYDEVTYEREFLTKQANTAEYCEKYQLSQDREKESIKEKIALKTRIGELQGQLRENGFSKESVAKLEAEVEKQKKNVEKIDKDGHQVQERLALENAALEERLKSSEARVAQSESMIKDLHKRLCETEVTEALNTPGAITPSACAAFGKESIM